jgi:23S rRNA (adenine2503-C2)-methyltransferase
MVDLPPTPLPANAGNPRIVAEVYRRRRAAQNANSASPRVQSSPMSPEPPRLDFFAQDAVAFDAAVVEWGWPRFRAQQVRDWVYGKLVADPAAMTNLSMRDREALAARVTFASAAVATCQHSSDGTLKLLLTWPDGSNAETVMIPDADRRTACVSSQIGCPVGCKFCASGINGAKGNLSAAQIVEQIHQLNVALKDEGGRRKDEKGAAGAASSFILHPSSLDSRITNLVFMGMGEPLANYANVMQAVRVLHDPKCFNIGARRITISTVGVPPRMRQLAEEELPLNLAISLHAPNEPLRKQLIPWAEHFALPEILDAARYYFDRTGREITLEYILLSGVNDRPEHARELARLCRTLRANVNLIRYNEVQGLPYERPKAQDVVRFQDILRAAGVNAHVRKSRGRDIDAACGQLRRNEHEKREREQLVTIAQAT